MKTRNVKSLKVFLLAIALMLLTIPIYGELLTEEEIDSLIEFDYYSRDRVVELITGIVLIADEEIVRTTEEAVKAATDPLLIEIAGLKFWKDNSKQNSLMIGSLGFAGGLTLGVILVLLLGGLR